MGSGVAVSIAFGQKDWDRLKRGVFLSFSGIGLAAVALSGLAFLGIDGIMRLLQVPEEIYELMRRYLLVIFMGIGGTFLYNYLACLLRAIGNSVTPLIFLGISAVLNVVLDLLFVLSAGWGVARSSFCDSDCSVAVWNRSSFVYSQESAGASSRTLPYEME